MKYYLIKYDGNYADEFDVYFHSVVDENTLLDIRRGIEDWEYEWNEYYFGTNESLEISRDDALEALDAAILLTDEQYKVLEDLELLRVSFGDGLNFDDLI